MKLEKYKKEALTRLNKSIANNSKEKMNYACLGISEETGEIVAEFRKSLFAGNFHEKKLKKEDIQGELGDLMWYIALICENENINMDELIRNEKQNETKISKREELIQNVMEISQNSGKIVDEYLKSYNYNGKKSELIKQIENQYSKICELSEILGFSIEEVLDKNIEKINSRYNEKGESLRKVEMQRN